MLTLRLIAVSALILALAACGGDASTTTSGGAQTSPAAVSGQLQVTAGASTTAEASTTQAPSGGQSQPSGGGADLDSLVQRLTPPNATETARMNVGGANITVTWDSSDSVDSLRSHYEGLFGNLGLTVVMSSTTEGTYVWFVQAGDNASLGGAVTVAPGSSGSGATVAVTLSIT